MLSLQYWRVFGNFFLDSGLNYSSRADLEDVPVLSGELYLGAGPALLWQQEQLIKICITRKARYNRKLWDGQERAEALGIRGDTRLLVQSVHPRGQWRRLLLAAVSLANTEVPAAQEYSRILGTLGELVSSTSPTAGFTTGLTEASSAHDALQAKRWNA